MRILVNFLWWARGCQDGRVPTETAPRPGPTRRPKDRRARIALAAAELFCQRGYPGVGIDDIAEVVGISGPAIYRHFPTKYAMLIHAMRELTDEILAATEPRPGQRLEDLLDDLAGIAVARRGVGGLYLWERRSLTTEDKAWLADSARIARERMAAPIVQSRPELGPTEVDLVVRGAAGVFSSIATHRAPVAPGRARQLLTRAAGRVIRADLAPAGPPRRPVVEAEPAPAPRREAVLLAALELFHTNGYHAVSMEEIGRAAGITGSSVYRHFPGKADLLAAVYHRAVQRVEATTAAALAAATGPAEALDQLVESYVDMVYGSPALISVYRAAHRDLPSDDRHDIRKAQRLHVEEWVTLLGQVRPELSQTAARILVHAALTVIVELGRLGHNDRIVTGLARTVLHS
jgi:AcrR family transcriptional regulator